MYVEAGQLLSTTDHVIVICDAWANWLLGLQSCNTVVSSKQGRSQIFFFWGGYKFSKLIVELFWGGVM